MKTSTSRPNKTEYLHLGQVDDGDHDDPDACENTGLLGSPSSAAAGPTKPSRHRRRRSSNGGSGRIDIHLDMKAQIEKWSDKIAATFKLKKGSGGDGMADRPLEIQHSVFQPPDWVRPIDAEALGKLPAAPFSRLQFDRLVERVRVAIEQDVHPTLISQGSSGSYFARDSSGRVVGVFKPKDEEPYASRNPKWTKWIHRNLFPFFFGRACLIPNLSYVSEAAACVLDEQLQTGIVPYTAVVSLSSKSFHYDFWDRRAFYRRKGPLPEKVGSFQVFLNGFTDATTLLKQHPWPDERLSRRRLFWPSRQQDGSARLDGPRPVISGGNSSGDSPDCSSDNDHHQPDGPDPADSPNDGGDEFWTPELQASFRRQLERLVILDYIMRNTDRGPDNWMIKIDRQAAKATIVRDPPAQSLFDSAGRDAPGSAADAADAANTRQPEPVTVTAAIGAIDNSLSWPWKHPDAWRSYPFGWLFLPTSLIGRPFSDETRAHFLPLLTSKAWWTETKMALRRCFKQDADFQEKMFARQMAVMKGQAWNVVETLKCADHGPLELTRRSRVCVWDDLVDVPTVLPLGPAPALSRNRAGGGQMSSSGRMREPVRSVRHARQPFGGRSLIGPTKDDDEQDEDEFDIGMMARDRSGPIRLEYRPINVPNPFNVARPTSPQIAQSAPSGSHHRSRHSLDSLVLSETGTSTGITGGVGDTDESRRDAKKYLFDDDAAGDLGYSTNENRDGLRKKVIVERLEMVKGKPPTFSWC